MQNLKEIYNPINSLFKVDFQGYSETLTNKVVDFHFDTNKINIYKIFN